MSVNDNEIVLTSNGIRKTIQELTLNDQVVGTDGMPKKITKITQNKSAIYKISQKKRN